MELTHASFFSGVGGTDLGLERAGWHTVSFSEVDPYASAVLAERWPGVPNLGDITELADRSVLGSLSGTAEPSIEDWRGRERTGGIWANATLWSGGFPCQDLSVAGKRRGFDGERSVLAFAFLALVERHHPPALLLENVPGLLSSHRGRDMARLLGHMAELGYGVAYRVLDAQHFGVPQRRRRVFILGLRSDPDDVDGRVAAERAAEVLSVGSRCGRHPATGHEKGTGSSGSPIAGAVLAREGKGIGHNYPDDHLIGTPPNADRVRAADGLAGRLDDSQLAFVKSARPREYDGEESWIEGRVMPTLNSFDVGDVRTTAAVVGTVQRHYGKGIDAEGAAGGHLAIGGGVSDDALLPLGLDSHRYRCCGNGVVAPVAEWLGQRLRAAL